MRRRRTEFIESIVKPRRLRRPEQFTHRRCKTAHQQAQQEERFDFVEHIHFLWAPASGMRRDDIISTTHTWTMKMREGTGTENATRNKMFYDPMRVGVNWNDWSVGARFLRYLRQSIIVSSFFNHPLTDIIFKASFFTSLRLYIERVKPTIIIF